VAKTWICKDRDLYFAGLSSKRQTAAETESTIPGLQLLISHRFIFSIGHKNRAKTQNDLIFIGSKTEFLEYLAPIAAVGFERAYMVDVSIVDIIVGIDTYGNLTHRFPNCIFKNKGINFRQVLTITDSDCHSPLVFFIKIIHIIIFLIHNSDRVFSGFKIL
jgi:hypothetical protein